MVLSEEVRAAAFAVAVVVGSYWCIWASTRYYLAIDYEDAESWKVRRSFPNRWQFQIAEGVLGLLFIASFVWVARLGPSDHTDLALMSLAMLVSYFAVLFVECVKAFRHFAANNLTPRGRGGYREP